MANYQLPPIDNPRQLEQLIADLLNEYYHTISFKCFGKNGHDQKGIDVFSAQKKMVVQCKHKDLSRSQAMIKRDLLADIDATILALKKKPSLISFETLLIATTASEHTDYDEYVAKLRNAHELSYEIQFWGWETIQQRLSHLPGVLAKYYPQYKISDLQVEDKLVSRLSMKKKIERDFADWLNYNPENRQFRSRMIIHSAADTHYPEHPNEDGPWYWFAAEIARLSVRGLGFINELADLYVNEQNQWTTNRPEDLSNFTVVRCAKISVVAFDDIIDYDPKGDEHYNCPHFYVRFNEDDSPFSEFYYQKLDNNAKGVPLFMDQTTELKT